MTNKIIYPLLIIIFSILIIYAIINYKNNNKLNSFIESYQNNSFNKNFKLDIYDNTFISVDFANGTWTIPESIVNDNYTITNLMTININNDADIKNISNYSNTNTYVGFQQQLFNFGTIDYNGEAYTINYVLNENIIAISNVNKLKNMHIKIYNKFTNEDNILINQPYYTSETLKAVVSIFNNNLLMTKFASYKVYNGKVGGEVYRIIKSKDIYIDQAPPLYDYKTYDVLMNNYKYPPNCVTPIFSGTTNGSSIVLGTFPSGKMLYSIQRVFYSPTGNNITTKASEPAFINISSGSQIPTYLQVCPFKQDKDVNSLEKFFSPNGTILYIYKKTSTNSSYNYGNANYLNYPLSSLKLSPPDVNNSMNMYGPNTEYLSINDLSSVQIVDENTYTMIKVGLYSPDPGNNNLESKTTIPFTDIISYMN
jgi:hypothetical protein